MSLEDIYTVKKIARKRVVPTVINNHYSTSMPNAVFSFGLFSKDDSSKIEGVCVFGTPPSTGFNATPWKTFELQRLVVINRVENLTSYLVSQALSKIEKGKLIVSYADQNMNHTGYIYQATNWIYTGEGGDSLVYILNGKETHTKNINDAIYKSRWWELNKNQQNKKSRWGLIQQLFPGITKQKLKPKYRYFYPLAKNKKQKKEMIGWIKDKFGIYPYPKGESKRYDMDEIKQQKRKEEKIKGFM